MPSPVEALPCGSRSTIRTVSPIAASAVPRLMAVVVLPTPPFWLAMARTRGTRAAPGSVLTRERTGVSAFFGSFSSISLIISAFSAQFRRFQAPNDDNHAIPTRYARLQLGLNSPIFSGLGQFSLYILALEE